MHIYIYTFFFNVDQNLDGDQVRHRQVMEKLMLAEAYKRFCLESFYCQKVFLFLGLHKCIYIATGGFV